MADKYAPQSAFNWDGDQWCNPDDGVQDVDKAGGDDLAYFTLNSGDCTVTEDAQCDGINMTGYTGTFALGAKPVDVDSADALLLGTFTGSGDFTIKSNIEALAGADFSGFTGGISCEHDSVDVMTLTSNAVVLPDLVIDNAGATSLTVQDNFTCASFSMIAGVLDVNHQEITANGNCVRTGGTLSNVAKCTMTANGNLALSAVTVVDWIVIEAGVTATLTGSAIAQKLTLPATATITQSGTRTLTLKGPPAADWWDVEGSIELLTVNLEDCGYAPGNDITVSASNRLSVFTNTTDTLTLDGDLTNTHATGKIAVYGNGPADAMTVIATGQTVSCLGTFILGAAGNTGCGKFTSGPLVSCGDLQGGNLANVGNTYTGSANSRLICTGTIDGDDGAARNGKITFTFGTNCRIRGGGTITDCTSDPGNKVNCRGMVDGGGNHANYRFVYTKARLLTLGAG